MYRAHTIRMKPNKAQHVLLMKHAGASRFAYNWGLERWQQLYGAWKEDSTKEKPGFALVSRLWTIERPEWALEIPRSPICCAFQNLNKAYTNFFSGRAKRPRKKKRSKGISFQVANDKASVKGRRIRLPNIGLIRLTEEFRFRGKIMGYTVRLYANHWEVTIGCDTPVVTKIVPNTVVGIDVGLQHPAVASDGTTLELPKEKLQRLDAKLRRAQRALARSQRNSKRGLKRLLKKQRIQEKITSIRKDAVHKFTTAVCQNHATVVTEDLDIQEMRTKAPARSVRRAYNASLMRNIVFQIGYKAVRHIKAPRFFPSTKRCSQCGHVKEAMPPNIRTYKCEACGAIIDRDANAARNLMLQPWVTR